VLNHVSLFAFSSENWKRPELEVRGLMSLFSSYLKKEAKALRDDGVRLKVIGNRSHFSDRLKRLSLTMRRHDCQWRVYACALC
jgi:undecaprenyl diphosphate synthase